MRNFSYAEFCEKFQNRFPEFKATEDFGFENIINDSILSVDFFCFLRDDLHVTLNVEKGMHLLKASSLEQCYEKLKTF